MRHALPKESSHKAIFTAEGLTKVHASADARLHLPRGAGLAILPRELAARRKHVGFAFQVNNLLPSRTARIEERVTAAAGERQQVRRMEAN